MFIWDSLPTRWRFKKLRKQAPELNLKCEELIFNNKVDKRGISLIELNNKEIENLIKDQ